MRSLARAAVAATTFTAVTIGALSAPAYAADVVTPHGETITNQYVVVLDGTVTARGGRDVAGVADTLTRSVKARRGYVYTRSIRGFSITATPAQAAKLALDRRVTKVYQDAKVRLPASRPSTSRPSTSRPSTAQPPASRQPVSKSPATKSPATESPVGKPPAPNLAGQPGPPWGLDRIDQRNLPLNGSYRYNVTAADVHAYVIDTGIRTDHTEFGGRASNGWDFVDNDAVAEDCDGHGTHVAGTIGGTTYGVAKNVRLVAVRVFDCYGYSSWSKVIAAVDWVTANAVRPAVANMSLGGGGYLPVDLAVQKSIESGVTYTLSAGNEDIDACQASPARTASAITVGATGNYHGGDPDGDPVSDVRASFSNFGRCLDLFAPGAGIRSSVATGPTDTEAWSGTSMAAPHVAGVAALYLSAFPDSNPMAVRNALVAAATRNVVVTAGTGSPNRLLHTFRRVEAAITLDAAPEPVAKGGTVTLSGRLAQGGEPLAGQTVQLFFTPAGTTTTTLMGTATTAPNGRYTRAFSQHVAGVWTATCPTTAATIGSSATDAVAVV